MEGFVLDSLRGTVLCNISLESDVEAEALSCDGKTERYLHVINVADQKLIDNSTVDLDLGFALGRNNSSLRLKSHYDPVLFDPLLPMELSGQVTIVLD
jgi:hypothetical protein